MTAEQIAELRQKHYNAAIVGLRQAHSDLVAIRVKPDWRLPMHKPHGFASNMSVKFLKTDEHLVARGHRWQGKENLVRSLNCRNSTRQPLCPS